MASLRDMKPKAVGTARKIVVNGSTMTPSNIAKMKLWIEAPPKKMMTKRTKRVESEVFNVRGMVALRDSLTTSAKALFG